MGYLTSHSITVESGSHDPHEIFSSFAAIFHRDETGLDLPCGKAIHGNTLFICTRKPAKWYDGCTQMKDFSKLFPTATFRVHGEGEEYDDVWEREFKNGSARERVREYRWGKWHDLMDSPATP